LLEFRDQGLGSIFGKRCIFLLGSEVTSVTRCCLQV